MKNKKRKEAAKAAKLAEAAIPAQRLVAKTFVSGGLIFLVTMNQTCGGSIFWDKINDEL